MMADPLIRAWLWLLGLSLVSTALAVLTEGAHGGAVTRLAGAAIVLVAFLKARVILRDYLDLARAPSFGPGFVAGIALLLAVLGGIYLAG